ncbi:transposable element Tcb1 transposase [Trichonephila clavipes]|nr:transposable element Tcb1 transposase [Trichonephila clavipes]
MSQRSHLTDSEAWRIVGRLEGGQTQAKVAQAIEVSQSIISRIWNRFLETGSAGRNQDKINIKYRRDHREWPTEHVIWRKKESSNVLFSDESRFSVHPDNRHIFIWWDRGSRSNPAFVHESVKFGGGGVLVYGGISIDGRTDLYIIRDGPLTAHRYRDEILRPIVVPYAAAFGDDIILMDDNCRPHRANLMEDFLFEKGIVRMEWPACSLDINPTEHVWNALGKRVAGRQPPPQTLQELKSALLEEWDRIPQLVINSLIDSMPQRCSTLLAVSGNHDFL